MVCEYSRDPDAHIVVLSPDPLFWEGFNLAGDDIVKSIVERVVLPPIAEYAREQGCTSTFECMIFCSVLTWVHKTGQCSNYS